MITPTDWIDALERDGGAVAATPPDRLDLGVPSCPGWTVRDLIVHLGAVHRWAAAFLAAGPDSEERVPFADDDAPWVLAIPATPRIARSCGDRAFTDGEEEVLQGIGRV
ncbi:hypothetical protein TPAU25S_00705 [Tsukamurella paurometabola]|uniref:maleylpyruvate isomerase N-terminal domain-containing protein n=1 Tax=Tsukamurella paurometabola TaxID=2061 RepID=UPI00019F01C7|nr:maleylpyruvate isomerase N-terminal domain-containing protein [Tsukamurella paurometabola]SUP36200.1 uncharacterized Actinobacterial protein [Tsukamurella paurometabola]